jgi:hypothetical protein
MNFPWLTSTLQSDSVNCVVVKVKVTLRLTVSQSISLRVEPHLGLMIRYLLLFDSYCLAFLGRPLWRDDGCILYMLLAIASVSFLRSESLLTREHILLSQIWDFLFRRLHCCVVAPNVFKITPWHGPRIKNTCHVFAISPAHWSAGWTQRKHITWPPPCQLIGAKTAA